MILFFFVSLALLTWQICRELERREIVAPQEAVSCGHCGGDVQGDWLVCPRCSSLLQEHCSACGEVHARDDRFCPWCGVGGQQAGV